MIDMTKKYQTRDGREVRILCVDGPHPSYPVMGYIIGQAVAKIWTLKGRYSLSGKEHNLDLVEVKPSYAEVVYFNIYGKGTALPYTTREQAEAHAYKDIKARIRVEFTVEEGRFDE